MLQVSSSYLLQLGSNQKNILFDAGGASLLNLYATQTNLSTIDKVRRRNAGYATQKVSLWILPAGLGSALPMSYVEKTIACIE